MEVQNKSSTRSEKVEVRERRMRRYVLLLRILGMGFTLVAAVVGGVNKERSVVAISLLKNMPPLHIPVTAEWYYLSSFVYFVVSNSIACSYAAASSVVFSVKAKSTQSSATLALLILDLVMVALLFSANGAAAGVGIISLKGNSHMRWNKVCNVVKAFCHQSTASIVMSLLGSFVFLWLVLLSILNMHKKSQ